MLDTNEPTMPYPDVLMYAGALTDAEKLDLVDALTDGIELPEIDLNKMHDAARKLRLALGLILA